MSCGEVLAVPTDVSDESPCKALIEKTIATIRRAKAGQIEVKL
jgi:hypothetical protein